MNQEFLVGNACFPGMQFQAGRTQIVPVMEKYIVHFPELSLLGGCHGCFSGFKAALMNFGQREMPEIKTDLPLKFFHDLLDNFVRFGAIFIFVFPEFYQGNWSCIRTYKYIPWFND